MASTCPRCGKNVSLGQPGTEVICPSCGAHLKVPGGKPAQAAPAMAKGTTPTQQPAVAPAIKELPKATLVKAAPAATPPLAPRAPGQQQALANAIVRPVVAVPVAPARDFSCPNCRSTQTQRVSVIFQSGTSASRSGGLGLGFAIDGDFNLTPVLGAASGGGSQQTNLARQLAPPQQPRDYLGVRLVSLILPIPLGVCLAGLLFGGPGMNYEIVSGAMLIFPVVLFMLIRLLLVRPARRAYMAEMAAFPRAMQHWEAQFFCNRCGHVFVPFGET